MKGAKGLAIDFDKDPVAKRNAQVRAWVHLTYENTHIQKHAQTNVNPKNYNFACVFKAFPAPFGVIFDISSCLQCFVLIHPKIDQGSDPNPKKNKKHEN